jgi:hypothetical protein
VRAGRGQLHAAAALKRFGDCDVGDTAASQGACFSAFHDLVGLPALRERERAADTFARELLERLAEPGSND